MSRGLRRTLQYLCAPAPSSTEKNRHTGFGSVLQVCYPSRWLPRQLHPSPSSLRIGPCALFGHVYLFLFHFLRVPQDTCPFSFPFYPFSPASGGVYSPPPSTFSSSTTLSFLCPATSPNPNAGTVPRVSCPPLTVVLKNWYPDLELCFPFHLLGASLSASLVKPLFGLLTTALTHKILHRVARLFSGQRAYRSLRSEPRWPLRERFLPPQGSALDHETWHETWRPHRPPPYLLQGDP